MCLLLNVFLVLLAPQSLMDSAQMHLQKGGNPSRLSSWVWEVVGGAGHQLPSHVLSNAAHE